MILILSWGWEWILAFYASDASGVGLDVGANGGRKAGADMQLRCGKVVLRARKCRF